MNEGVWNIGRMMLTREKVFIETLSQYHSPTMKPTWTGLGSNQGLHSDRLATKHQSHGMVIGVFWFRTGISGKVLLNR